MFRLLALLPLLAIGAGPPAPPVPVAVELFTSQGCSSCPPADAFFEELAQRSDLVVMVRPVTYWDRLGWKDSLAREENTQLQRRYAACGGEGSGVYTPQSMVQGQLGAVGSSRGEVLRQISRAHRAAKAAIAISDGHVGVAGTGSGEVQLISLMPPQTVRIGSGENGGRAIRYINVVSGEQTIGEWRGGQARFALPIGAGQKAGRQAIIVRNKASREIVAARYL